jgi:hypothetical protein
VTHVGTGDTVGFTVEISGGHATSAETRWAEAHKNRLLRIPIWNLDRTDHVEHRRFRFQLISPFF